MSMETMYWVSQIYSWNYIDIAGKTHGRIDWFEDMCDVGYWWQTSYETGSARTVERAKRGVEEAVMRRRMALEARYLGGVADDSPVAPDSQPASAMQTEPAPGAVAWTT